MAIKDLAKCSACGQFHSPCVPVRHNIDTVLVYPQQEIALAKTKLRQLESMLWLVSNLSVRMQMQGALNQAQQALEGL